MVGMCASPSLDRHSGMIQRTRPGISRFRVRSFHSRPGMTFVEFTRQSRQAAGDEPEARLRRAGVHVAQFLLLAESPDRADAFGDRIAEQFAHQMLLRL